LEKKIPFVVKGAFLPSNKDEIKDFERWAKKVPGMDKPPSYALLLDFRCRQDKSRNKLIRGLRLSPKEVLGVLTRHKRVYLKDKKDFCSKFMRPPGKLLLSCGAGKGSLCLDAYGILQPCMMLRHRQTVYHLKKGSLKEALEDFFPKLRRIRAVNPDYLRRCARCFLKGLCEQCPAKSYMEHGRLDTPVEYLCQVAHEEARFLGLVGEKENAWEVKNWQGRIKRFALLESPRHLRAGVRSKNKITHHAQKEE
jgi:radical SAM protein with 4Fe4S-binding SPASM domain